MTKSHRGIVPPDHPDLDALPTRVDRRRGAELVTQRFFPVSARSLERWGVPVRHVNGKAVMDTAELFAAAQAKLDAAPAIRGGRRAAPSSSAAVAA